MLIERCERRVGGCRDLLVEHLEAGAVTLDRVRHLLHRAQVRRHDHPLQLVALQHAGLDGS